MKLTPQEFKSAQINWTLAVISITLLVHEFIITFTYEVERFWPRWLRSLFDFDLRGYKLGSENGRGSPSDAAGRQYGRVGGCGFPWTSFFFFTNRYLIILGHIPVMAEYFWIFKSMNTRQKMYVFFSRDLFLYICLTRKTYEMQAFRAVSSVLSNNNSVHRRMYVFAFVTSADLILKLGVLVMRVYALYDCRKGVLALFIATFLGVGTIGLWAVISNQTVDSKPQSAPIPYGCNKEITPNAAIHLAAVWSGNVVFDVLVFGLTLYKTLTLPHGSGAGLLTVLTRDGTMYFGMMVVASVGNVITFILASPLGRGSFTMFTNVISSIMVSRLMFNLRDPRLNPQGIRGWNDRNDDVAMSGHWLPQESTINGRSCMMTSLWGDPTDLATGSPSTHQDADEVQEVAREVRLGYS